MRDGVNAVEKLCVRRDSYSENSFLKYRGDRGTVSPYFASTLCGGCLAKTGDPNGEGLPKWPVYAADTQWQVMHLGPEPMAAPDRHRAQDVLLEVFGVNSCWGKRKRRAD